MNNKTIYTLFFVVELINLILILIGGINVFGGLMICVIFGLAFIASELFWFIIPKLNYSESDILWGIFFAWILFSVILYFVLVGRSMWN